MNLQDLSKDTLIEIHRAVHGNVGDSARTSKAEYINILAQSDAAAVASAVAAVAPKGNDDAAAARKVREALNALGIGGQLDENRVRELIADALANVQPRIHTHVVREPSGATVTLDEHTHPVFAETVDACAAGLNVLLVGPAGCGKSHLAEQVARSLGRTFNAIHVTAGMSESQLLGWLLPISEGGKFEHVMAPYANAYGSDDQLFLIDEIDNGDANTLGVMNGSLANGHLHIPQRFNAPTLKRGSNVAIVAAANTFGTGSDMLYVGRNALDAATLDRFYVIDMDYDPIYEQSLVSASGIAQADELYANIVRIRGEITAKKLRRVLSTRSLQKSLTMLRHGDRYSLAHVTRRMLAGWTADELAKVGA